jgi:hypothetical protein
MTVERDTAKMRYIHSRIRTRKNDKADEPIKYMKRKKYFESWS